jgi:hypothetical protein
MVDGVPDEQRGSSGQAVRMSVIKTGTAMDITIALNRDSTVSVPTSIRRLGPFYSVS